MAQITQIYFLKIRFLAPLTFKIHKTCFKINKKCDILEKLLVVWNFFLIFATIICVSKL